jgi:pantoate--beta-alanine ligase
LTIETITTISELRKVLNPARAAGTGVGFVPTMGFLHDGHASLMRAAKADNDLVVASIFVNPLQFGADEDLEDYPRDIERDTDLAHEAGVSLLFTPRLEEMYPFGPVLTSVSVDQLAGKYEGETRPTHFSGMATVVSKLFNIVGPCRAYFGEKDYQQLAIIRRIVADLSIPVEVVGCPIVREPDGVVMSSRNTYLHGADRTAATVLRRALDAGLAAIEAGERNRVGVEAVMLKIFAAEPLATLDYAVVVDAANFEVPATLVNEVRLLVAAQVGRPRLLDNCGVSVTGQEKMS